MDYRFVVIREAAWAAFVAAVLVLLQALATLDLSTITDLRAWLIALAVSGVRAAAAALLAAFTKGFVMTDGGDAEG